MHGKVHDISLYNRDPYPKREDPMYKKKEKMKVPPFRTHKELYALYLDKVERDKKLEELAKKKA